MHLSTLKLWNFRKCGAKGENNDQPGLIVEFKEGLNVLIGENDSGKTAVVDAIRSCYFITPRFRIHFFQLALFEEGGF